MEKGILLLIVVLAQCTALPQRDLNAIKSPVQTHQQQQKSPSPTRAKILKQINTLNDDGSYTFGYEADDGSFKVETRSKDGVVKGKYGFIDPSGQLKTVEYSAGEKSDDDDEEEVQGRDLSMAGATDSKSVTKTRQANQNQADDSEEDEEEDDDNEAPYRFSPQSSPSPNPQNVQFPRQTGGQGQVQNQYFREIPAGNGNGIGVGNAAGAGQPVQQQFGGGSGGGPRVNSFGEPVFGNFAQNLQGPGSQQQFANRQFDEGEPAIPPSTGRFPAGSRPLFGGAGGRQQQFPPQSLAQLGQFGGAQQFANPQQGSPFFFPQGQQPQFEGGFIGSQGPINSGGGPGSSQQFFGNPASAGQGQQPFNQFGNVQRVPGAGAGQQQFGGFGGPQFQQDFDDQSGFGLGGFGNDFGGFPQYNGNGVQQNQNQLFGLGGGAIGGTARPAVQGISGIPGSSRQPQQSIGASAGGLGGNSQEYVPSIELDGFSEDPDQDGFDTFPGSDGSSDKKTAQTEEKSPDVKTTDGRKVGGDSPQQYRPQILGPQQVRPGGGLAFGPGAGFAGVQQQQQQPQIPGLGRFPQPGGRFAIRQPGNVNQFGLGPSSPFNDQFNQLYQQQGQPQIIPGQGQGQGVGGGGRPQQQFGGGVPIPQSYPTNTQFLGGFPQQLGPQYFQQPQGFQQQGPFLAGRPDTPVLPQGISQGGSGQAGGGIPQGQGQTQVPQQQQINPTQPQIIPTRPTNSQSDFNNAGIQQQYIPFGGQEGFFQQPQSGFGFQPGFQGAGAYPGYNPYAFGGPEQFGGPYNPAAGFQSGLVGPQQFPQSQFPGQAFLGNQSQRGGGSSSVRLGGGGAGSQQSQQPQQSQSQISQQQLGQGTTQQLSLGGLVTTANAGGGGSERVTRDDSSVSAAVKNSNSNNASISSNINTNTNNGKKEDNKSSSIKTN